MTLTFINHQWKAFLRSKNTGKTIAVKVTMTILIVYLLLNVLVLSFFLDKILEKLYPASSILESFNRFVLYYFLLDLLMRFQFQELPTLAIKPYLHLPLKRNRIVNYLCFSSVWSGFNFSTLLIALPFLIKVVLMDYGSVTFWAYLFSVLGLTIFSHFFSLWFKRKVNLNGWYLLGFFLLYALVFVLDQKAHFISISDFSAVVFGAITKGPWLCLLPLALGVIMFVVNYLYLRSNLYLEELRSETRERNISTNIPFLGQFGVAGELAVSELKLILRNKRTKSSLRICLIMLFYGLIFYTNPAQYSQFGWKIFASMFMTGIFIINYGQFMYAWQSSHFDGLLVMRVRAEDFIRSKFVLFTLFSTAAFILTIPYVYFGWEILLVQFCMYVWNLGVNSLIILWFANKNHKRLDLSKSASFNWEGVGASQFLVSIPLMLSPFVIYIPFAIAGFSLAGIMITGFVGLLFILTRSFWVNILVKKFNESRYDIAEGFRQK